MRATKLTEGIKLATVKALAALGRSEEEETHTFDAKHLLPNALNSRLLTTLTPTVAKAAMEEGVAQKPIENWTEYIATLKLITKS